MGKRSDLEEASKQNKSRVFFTYLYCRCIAERIRCTLYFNCRQSQALVLNKRDFEKHVCFWSDIHLLVLSALFACSANSTSFHICLILIILIFSECIFHSSSFMSNFIFHMEHSHVLCMIIQCCISTKEIPIECVKLILIELNLLLLFFFFLFRRNIFIHQGVQMFLLFAIAILKKGCADVSH